MKILILVANHAFSFIIQAEALAKGFEQLHTEHTIAYVTNQHDAQAAIEAYSPDRVIPVGNWTDYELIIKPSLDLHYTTIPWIVADDYVIDRYISEYNNLPVIVTPSNHCKENFIRSGIQEQLFTIIPEAVDPDIWRPLKKEVLKDFVDLISIPIHTSARVNKFDLAKAYGTIPIIFTTGGEATKKGAQEVIRALASLPKSIPYIYIIKMWPSPVTFQKSIEELTLAENLGIIDRVRYISGEYSERFMTLLMNISDIYAGPSRHEGFGLPHVQAQMCSIPVVTMAATSAQETTVHNETGFISKTDPRFTGTQLPRANIKDLAQYLEKLLTNNELRREMGKNALNHALANYTPAIIAQKFIDMI